MECLPLETVFWFCAGSFADSAWGRRGWWSLCGEGLGGGYCTPPNRTRRERSELIFRGVWGEPLNGKLSTGGPSVFVKTSVKRVLRKKNRQ